MIKKYIIGISMTLSTLNLDVDFGEDKNQLSGNGAENFSLLSKIALNLLKQDKTTKLSIPNKRFRASMDQTYLETIMKAVA